MTNNKELQRITGTALILTFMLNDYIKHREYMSVFDQPSTGEDDYLKIARDTAEEVYQLLIKEAAWQEMKHDPR